MAGVPRTAMVPPRVRAAAACAPGSITPTTGMGRAAEMAGRLSADTVLQATTSILMPRAAR